MTHKTKTCISKHDVVRTGKGECPQRIDGQSGVPLAHHVIDGACIYCERPEVRSTIIACAANHVDAASHPVVTVLNATSPDGTLLDSVAYCAACLDQYSFRHALDLLDLYVGKVQS